jgi:hypothetical protein
LKGWEKALLEQAVYSETDNGASAKNLGSTIAHVYINRVEGIWSNMWEATKPPQSAIGKLWGEAWQRAPTPTPQPTPVPIPTTLEDAIAKTNEWTIRLNNGAFNPQGWSDSKSAVTTALEEVGKGIDPTMDSIYFVALGRTIAFDEQLGVYTETLEEFEQRFWGDYNREIQEVSRRAEQDPNFIWTITAADNVAVLSGGKKRVAILTSNNECITVMNCSP